jgi:hypothetical protein
MAGASERDTGLVSPGAADDAPPASRPDPATADGVDAVGDEDVDDEIGVAGHVGVTMGAAAVVDVGVGAVDVGVNDIGVVAMGVLLVGDEVVGVAMLAVGVGVGVGLVGVGVSAVLLVFAGPVLFAGSDVGAGEGTASSPCTGVTGAAAAGVAPGAIADVRLSGVLVGVA